MQAARILPWLALATALSPTGVEIARHMLAEPWALYVLWFVVLLPFAIRHEPGEVPAHRFGFALVVAALMIQLFGIGGEFVRFSRPALPLAVIGLCLALGVAPLRVALLSLWWVPVPSLFLTVLSPGLENSQMNLVTGALAALGLPLELVPIPLETGPNRPADAVIPLAAQSGAAQLVLGAGINGIPTLALLSGLGWYAGLRQGDSTPGLVSRALKWGLVAIPVQLATLTLALVVLSVGGGTPAQAVLLGVQLPLGAAGIFFAERGSLRKRQTAR